MGNNFSRGNSNNQDRNSRDNGKRNNFAKKNFDGNKNRGNDDGGYYYRDTENEKKRGYANKSDRSHNKFDNRREKRQNYGDDDFQKRNFDGQERRYNKNYNSDRNYQDHKQKNYRSNGYKKRYSDDGDDMNNNFRSGNTYVDQNGFHHRKYWSHEDRKKKSLENQAEREDDQINFDGTIRLNKFLANSGMCSRREADRMIATGMVTVNGKVVTEMGIKVGVTDEVQFNGQTIKPEKKRYLLLNKPKDYITTLRDPHARNTVMELIQGACKERIYPVGRLDRNTTGVLLFTNDGDLAKKLTHPSNEVQKIYHVSLDKNLSMPDMQKIFDGFELEDGFIKADEIAYIDGQSKSEIGIRIHSGRNRIVRRIFEHLGYEVKKLDRVMFAGLDKRGLTRGHWRFLTDAEVGFLQMVSNKNAKDMPYGDVKSAIE